MAAVDSKLLASMGRFRRWTTETTLGRGVTTSGHNCLTIRSNSPFKKERTMTRRSPS